MIFKPILESVFRNCTLLLQFDRLANFFPQKSTMKPLLESFPSIYKKKWLDAGQSQEKKLGLNSAKLKQDMFAEWGRGPTIL